MQSILDNPQTWALTGGKVTVWLLVMTRVTGLLAGLPGLGNERLPLQVRAALAVMIAVVMTPALPPMKIPPASVIDLASALAVELAVNRKTVEAAWQQLEREGRLQGQGRPCGQWP